MGRSFRGRRSRAGSPTQSAAERRAALAEHDDLADADAVVREKSRRTPGPWPDEFGPYLADAMTDPEFAAAFHAAERDLDATD